jgi:hypothetical protein
MSTASDPAGSAAPTLPHYHLSDLFGSMLHLATLPAGHGTIAGPARVSLLLQGQQGGLVSLIPSAARLLAVYLVDCANALDDPANRVIV